MGRPQHFGGKTSQGTSHGAKRRLQIQQWASCGGMNTLDTVNYLDVIITFLYDMSYMLVVSLGVQENTDNNSHDA